jgi:ribosomal protein L1
MESPPAEWRERIKNLQVTQVLSVRQLRRDYHQFERRRQLVSAHQLFLADTRIWPMLPELLGKEFFRRKKYPLPVKFFGLESAKPIAAERIIRACERIRDSTVWYPGLAVAGAGTCCSLRVGHLAMSSAALKANVLQVLEALPSLIPGGIRRGVLSMYLKTKELVPIPVYVAARSPDTRSTTAPIASKFKLWSPEHRRSKGKLVRVPDGQMTPLQRKKYRKRGMRRRGRGEKQ